MSSQTTNMLIILQGFREDWNISPSYASCETRVSLNRRNINSISNQMYQLCLLRISIYAAHMLLH